MSNQSDRQIHNKEVRQEIYNDANGNTYTNVSRTSETVNSNQPKTNSYSDGYVHGMAERRHTDEALVERDNNNAARGLIIGILLTSIAALTAGAIWLFNQSNQTPTQVTPVIVPTQRDQTPPKPEQPPQKETIIERTRDVLVPVPQPQAPSPAPKQDINITVPNTAPQQPAQQKAPATQTSPTQPQPQSSNIPQTKPSDTEEAASDTSKQTNTTDSSSAPDKGDKSKQTDTTDSSSAPTQTDNTSGSNQ